MRIAIIAFDGFDELDAIAPYEVFRHAARHGADLEATVVTVTHVAEVVAAGGLFVRPHGSLDGAPDLALIPGGRGVGIAMERGELPEVIRGLHEGGCTIATVCTGALLAAAAGIVAGRSVTTHHAALDALRDSGADVVEGARVVDDGDLVSAGGVTCGIDLALWLVEREFDGPLADAVAAEMEYARSAPVRPSGAVSSP